MSRVETLRRLERLIEDFLQEATAQKEERLAVLEGINRLDDLARAASEGTDVSDGVAEWFADRRGWTEGSDMRPADRGRIQVILTQLDQQIKNSAVSTPVSEKVLQTIRNWLGQGPQEGSSVTMRRAPEPKVEQEVDSVVRFRRAFESLGQLYDQMSPGKDHVLSVLDQSLRKAVEERDREALLLSAYIIYYLRLGNYLVEPYVRRLKLAEKLFAREDQSHA